MPEGVEDPLGDQNLVRDGELAGYFGHTVTWTASRLIGAYDAEVVAQGAVDVLLVDETAPPQLGHAQVDEVVEDVMTSARVAVAPVAGAGGDPSTVVL